MNCITRYIVLHVGQPDKVLNESIGIHDPCTINISWTPPKSLKPLDGYVVILNEESTNFTVNNSYILLPVNSYNLSIMAMNKVSIGPAVNVIINKSDINISHTIIHKYNYIALSDTRFNLTKAVVSLKESQWFIKVSIPVSTCSIDYNIFPSFMNRYQLYVKTKQLFQLKYV